MLAKMGVIAIISVVKDVNLNFAVGFVANEFHLPHMQVHKGLFTQSTNTVFLLAQNKLKSLKKKIRTLKNMFSLLYAKKEKNRICCRVQLALSANWLQDNVVLLSLLIISVFRKLLLSVVKYKTIVYFK